MADTRLKERSLFDPEIMRPAIWESFRKLAPQPRDQEPGHVRGRDRQRADHFDLGARSCSRRRQDLSRSGLPSTSVSGCGSPWFSPTSPKRWPKDAARPRRRRCARCARKPPRGAWSTVNREEVVPASALRKGDTVVVEAGEIIPGDGDVIQGIASVDESAITGESAPVIRESGGDRSAVTGGTKVLSDRIVVRITASPGESFLDRMIALVEGAERQKTPNEIALNILLAGLTLVFLFACVTLVPMALYSGMATVSVTVIVALLVCLIPTTIGGLAFGHRYRRHRSVAAKKRARHERARRRGRRRCRHSAFRQDRHDHARQPHGDRVYPCRRRERRKLWRTPPSSRASPMKLRKAARSSCWRRRNTDCAVAT